jgi:hypothetical protein
MLELERILENKPVRPPMISTLQMRGLVSHGERQYSSQSLCLSLTFLFSYKFHPVQLTLSDFLHTKPKKINFLFR